MWLPEKYYIQKQFSLARYINTNKPLKQLEISVQIRIIIEMRIFLSTSKYRALGHVLVGSPT